MKPALDPLIAAVVALGVAALLVMGMLNLRQSWALEAPPATSVPAFNETAPDGSATKAAREEVVVFAGGCFWGVQGVFQHVKGVTRAVSGYSGGSAANAHYYLVGTGGTGHAESVQVTYDPARIRFADLMRIFFSVAHDPTQRDRQGPDRGPQYRSAIFTTTPEQTRQARDYVKQLDDTHVLRGAITTQITEGQAFYAAEDYHQDYLTLHPDDAYIRINDLPKVRDLKRLYPDWYRDEPVLVATR